MPTRRDLLIASAALATGAFAGARASPRQRPLGEVQDELRKLIPDLLRRYNVPGLSLAMVREQEIVWAEAFGLRDREANAPLSPDTVFEAASLSKPAYAYAVLKLVEQGKLGLHTPLIEYFGRSLNPDEPRIAKVTAWHVLSHSSGIEPQPADHPTRLVFAPGERFDYSPHGFDYLQKSVERATGATIVPMTERLLFKPFGLKQSAFGWSEAYAASGARGYDDKGVHQQTFDERMWRASAEERAKILAMYPLESVPNAAASLHCTPSDYARFLIEVMRPADDGIHLSPGMLKEMLTAHVRVEGIDGLFWGLGFGMQRPSAGPESFWHTGDWGIFQHFAVGCRDEGSALVVMTNAVGMRACRDVNLRVLGYEQPAFKWAIGG